MSHLPSLIFDLVRAEEIPDAIVIEKEGFPPDEAASVEMFRFRQDQAPGLFLGAFVPLGNGARKIVGYVCSTLSSSKNLTHDSMSFHDPNGKSVCIHSICVDKSCQKRGVGLKLLKEYVSRLQQHAKAGLVPYERIILITHDNLIPFYEKAGFTSLGKSNVVHGSLPWYELQVDLENANRPVSRSASVPFISGSNVAAMPPAQQENQQIPTGLWEALLQSTAKNKRSGKLLASFSNGLGDVLTSFPGEAGVSVNKYDLLCPRPGCGSIILRKGVATWVERASEQLQPPGIPPNPLLPPLPPAGDTTQWWLITPSPMLFENIEFSQLVENNGSRKKLLACAECDLGPLGWCEEGGSEFWLACSHVLYYV